MIIMIVSQQSHVSQYFDKYYQNIVKFGNFRKKQKKSHVSQQSHLIYYDYITTKWKFSKKTEKSVKFGDFSHCASSVYIIMKNNSRICFN